MTQRSGITRRTFLYLGTILSTVGLSGVARALAGSIGLDATTRLAYRLVHLVGNKDSARIVGLEYLHRRIHEADAQVLVFRILGVDPRRHPLADHPDLKVRRAIFSALKREDFRDGRIVPLRGWMLSETEARLCALVALPYWRP